MRNLQFTDSALAGVTLVYHFFKCEYLNFAEKMVSPIDNLLSHIMLKTY